MLLESKIAHINSPIPSFSLPGTNGAILTNDSFNNYRILVIVFMCNHCPYVQAVIGRLISFQKEFESKGVKFIGINSNDVKSYPEDSFKKMKEYYSKWNMNFPYLFDETQEVARAFDAVCTPDIYVYDDKRHLKYRGRIDDNWKDENTVTKRELYKAILMMLENKELTGKQYPSMGCSIKWK